MLLNEMVEYFKYYELKFKVLHYDPVIDGYAFVWNGKQTVVRITSMEVEMENSDRKFDSIEVSKEQGLFNLIKFIEDKFYSEHPDLADDIVNEGISRACADKPVQVTVQQPRKMTANDYWRLGMVPPYKGER